MESQQWWKVGPLSKKTGLPVSTLYRWARDGTLAPRYIKQLPSKTLVIDINGLFTKRTKKTVRGQQRTKEHDNDAESGGDV